MGRIVSYALVAVFGLSAAAGVVALISETLGVAEPPTSMFIIVVWVVELPLHGAAAAGLLLHRSWGWLAATFSVAEMWVVQAGWMVLASELPPGRAVAAAGGLGVVAAAFLALLDLDSVRGSLSTRPPGWLERLFPLRFGLLALSLIVAGISVSVVGTRL